MTPAKVRPPPQPVLQRPDPSPDRFLHLDAQVPPATPQLLPVTVSQLLSAPQGGHDAFFVGSLELNQVLQVVLSSTSAGG